MSLMTSSVSRCLKLSRSQISKGHLGTRLSFKAPPCERSCDKLPTPHRSTSDSTMATRSRSQALKHCPLCRDFCTRQVSGLIKDIGLVHASTTGPFHIVCGLGGCQRLFSNFQTYRNHLYSIHTDSDALDLQQPAPLPITSLVCGDGGGGGDDREEDTTCTTAHNRGSSDLLQEAAARFILKTKESHRLTQTTMICIIEDITSFNQIMLGERHYATSEALSAAGVDPQIICSLAPFVSR